MIKQQAFLARLSPLRSAAIGFGFAAAAMLAAQYAGAQSIAGHNSDAPVDFGADRIELQDRQGRVVLSGNVDITQAGLRLRAARTTIAYSNSGGLTINRIDATGGVLVTRGNESARGDAGVYDFNRRIITLVGNVALRRGADNLNGGRLVIDLQSGLTSVDGRAGGGSPAVGAPSSPDAPIPSAGGRVTGSFSVPKRGGN